MKYLKNIAGMASLFVALFAGALPASAADKATPEEAVALVKKAIVYLKKNGQEAAFAEFNNPQGRFVEKDMYIFVTGANLTMLAHGANQRLVGKNLVDLKDADGKPFGRMMFETANNKGSGWVDYKWPNPVHKVIEEKSTYVEKSGELIFAAGIYK